MPNPPLWRDRSRDGSNLSHAIENPGPVDPASALPLRAHSIATLAELRKTVGSNDGNAGPRVCMLAGHTLPLDAGAGIFAWDATSTAADDAGTTASAFTTARPQGVAVGRWRRLTDGGFKMTGTKTNNAAAPAADNVGVLAAQANAAAQAWTEGRLVILSVDLAGNLRTLAAGSLTNNGAAPGATNIGALIARANAAAPAWTEGNQVLASVDLVGNLRARMPEAALMVTATAAVNTGFTLTLPAAGAGLFHYITSIDIVRATNATATAAGAALTITTTNLPGNPVWTFGNASTAGGTAVLVRSEPTRPLKSSVANTATTIVVPAAGAGEIIRANVQYYTGP